MPGASIRINPFSDLFEVGGRQISCPPAAAYFPPGLANGEIKRYVEPFIGSGLFSSMNSALCHRSVHLSDLNPG
jgi:hypothetical protein